MYDILKQNFLKPSPQFTPYPFWLLNDELDEKKLLEQIDDFHAKGVDGFVLHPRQGLPKTIPYMSDIYLDYIELCVKRAAELKMTVILYDEAAYPSGSAHGMVAASNPEFAARALNENGELVFTGGTIRGVHENEDDGESEAPLAADLLNPEAVKKFIELTHEKYYARLKKYFGDTIIAMFTDEPSLTGRGCNMNGKITWTYGFMEDFVEAGGKPELVGELFKADGDPDMHRAYNKAIRKRLADAYYKPLSEWCKSHYISLTGHPDRSGETDMLRYFQIPGQDLVWRWVEPEDNLTSPHSVVGKCSSDMARHMNAHRNANEVLGVCGAKGNPWNFTSSDMMWYFNHLFARGVNMLVLHAFYYSLRTKMQWDERPPDAGLNNIWWRYYKRYSDYIKRMSWLNTNSANKPYAAVLCSGDNMPYLSVRGLYENCIDFNYLNISLMKDEWQIKNRRLVIGRYAYDILLVDDSLDIDRETEEIIHAFEYCGGKVCRSGDFTEFVKSNAEITETISPYNPDIRLVRLSKSGVPFILIVNESDKKAALTLSTELTGKCESFNPFTGEINAVPYEIRDGKALIELEVQPRIPAILAFNTDEPPLLGKPEAIYSKREISFDGSCVNIKKNPGERYILTFDEVHDQCRVYINNCAAGELLFIPWELDVTDYISDGENNFTFEIDESKANTYGKPVPTGVFGAKIIIFSYMPE